MLDMDLIRGKPAQRIDFQVSLAADVISSMYLVLGVPSIEGLDQWVYTTHSALSDAIRADMGPVLLLIGRASVYYAWLEALPVDHPVHHDFSAYIEWLNSFSLDDYRQLLDVSYEMLKTYCEDPEVADIASPSGVSADEAEMLHACYGEILDEPQIERLIQLCHNPGEFKTQVISLVTRFWEQFYRENFERCWPLMERSVAYHRGQSYGADLITTFVNVTGRRFPKDHEMYEAAERIIFMPSCHIGPYVMINPCDENNATLMIHYNARPTGTPEPEEEEISSIQDLFPPLKALADETRLQILSLLNGRELYAQEIVDELDISQSAVSRHLALMVTGGILDVRRENSMKYFTINTTTLAALAEGLKRFREP